VASNVRVELQLCALPVNRDKLSVLACESWYNENRSGRQLWLKLACFTSSQPASPLEGRADATSSHQTGALRWRGTASNVLVRAARIDVPHTRNNPPAPPTPPPGSLSPARSERAGRPRPDASPIRGRSPSRLPPAGNACARRVAAPFTVDEFLYAQRPRGLPRSASQPFSLWFFSVRYND
jgi:hypothetical protein